MKQLLLRSEGIILVLAAPFLLFPTVFLPGTAVSLLLLALLWLVSAVNKKPWPSSPINGALLVWVIAVLVGVLVSADPELTLPKTTGLLLGVAILRYLSYRNDRERRLKWGLAGFFAFGLLIILVGIISADWRFEVSFVETFIGWLPPRLITLPEGQSAGVHMNQLAGSILPYPLVFIALLWGWRQSTSQKTGNHTGARHFVAEESTIQNASGSAWHLWSLKVTKTILILATILLLALLFLTQSRGGWLGFIVGLVSLILTIVWWSVPKMRRRLMGIGLASTAVLLISAVLFTRTPTWDQLWQRPPQDTVVGDLSTLEFRREVWLWGVTAVEDFPFTGTGLGTFRRVVPRLYPIAVPANYDIAHAHNIFLQVALDTGLPGLIAYLALSVTTCVIGWRTARDSVKKRPLLLGLLAALIAIHAYGLGDALAPGSKPTLTFWLILALINALHDHTGARHFT